MNSVSQSKLRYFLPSIVDIFFVTILLFVVFVDAGFKLLRDADTGFHIMTGRYVLENHWVPVQDIFSYTVVGQKWFAFSWGTGFLYSIMDKFAGLNGVVLLTLLLILGTLFIIYRLLMHWNANFFVITLSITLVTCLTTVHWLARPHIFTMFFTALVFYFLELAKEKKFYYYLIPPVMIFWVNVHPGFISGFFMIALYFVGNLVELILNKNEKLKDTFISRLKALVLIGIISVLCTMLNPYGPELYIYIYKTLTSSWIVNATHEYFSPNFHNTMGVIVYALILLLLILMSLNNTRRVLDFPKIFVLLLWIHLSLFAVRNIALFAVIGVPCLALLMQDLLDKRPWPLFEKLNNSFMDIEKSLKYHFWPVFLFVILLIIALNNGYLLDKKVMNCRFSEEYIPVKALEYVKNNPIKGNMLNQDNWGGYIIYAHPDLKVFMDGRLDMYQQEFLGEFQMIIDARPGWQNGLDKYNVRWVLFGNNTYMHNILDNSPDWKVYYTDDVATIFIRKVQD